MTPNPPEDKTNIGSESLTDQFIADTYYGELHTANVPITGERFPYVYDGYGNQSTLQLGISSIKVNGLEFPQAFIDMLYPVGAIYLSSDNINPSNHIPYTSWVRISQGRFLAGVGGSTDANGTNGTISSGDDNVGEYIHTLTIEEMPAHDHILKGNDRETLSGQLYASGLYKDDAEREASDPDSISYTGGDQPHNNTPPAFGIYVWKRIN